MLEDTRYKICSSEYVHMGKEKQLVYQNTEKKTFLILVFNMLAMCNKQLNEKIIHKEIFSKAIFRTVE